MWLFTEIGFFSCTRSKDDFSKMQMRARERVDLTNLIDELGLKAKILETPEADYRYRIIVEPAVFLDILTGIGQRIGYSNFKDAVHGVPNQANKNGPYMRVWSTMNALQNGSRGSYQFTQEPERQTTKAEHDDFLKFITKEPAPELAAQALENPKARPAKRKRKTREKLEQITKQKGAGK